MTVEEFENRFDILYNNIASNASFPLNEYEKSVFLSQAQKEIITEIYNGKGDSGLSFESTEEARAYLRGLIITKTVDLSTITHSNKHPFLEYKMEIGKDKQLPSNIMFITYEEVLKNNESPAIEVIPVKQDDLHNWLKNPFKRPSKTKVLRYEVNNSIYLYSNKELQSYIITYLKSPEPIRLKNIDSRIEIDGIECTSSSAGDSPEILHSYIVERAVALAKKAYIG